MSRSSAWLKLRSAPRARRQLRHRLVHRFGMLGLDLRGSSPGEDTVAAVDPAHRERQVAAPPSAAPTWPPPNGTPPAAGARAARTAAPRIGRRSGVDGNTTPPSTGPGSGRADSAAAWIAARPRAGAGSSVPELRLAAADGGRRPRPTRHPGASLARRGALGRRPAPARRVRAPGAPAVRRRAPIMRNPRLRDRSPARYKPPMNFQILAVPWRRRLAPGLAGRLHAPRRPAPSRAASARHGGPGAATGRKPRVLRRRATTTGRAPRLRDQRSAIYVASCRRCLRSAPAGHLDANGKVFDALDAGADTRPR
jgi:hypothetical protein